MEALSYGILLLGLIFDIILILLVIVSVLLIYSLLQITIEHKTFESGIMRLVGLTKAGYLQSIFLQSTLFVLPSIVCAFLASPVALHYLFKKLGVPVVNNYFDLPIPAMRACVIGLFLGLCIPAISSIVPILNALSRSLSDSLNVQRSKTKGEVITVSDSKTNVLPYLLFGFLCILYGVSIFFLLPYSLL